MGSSSLAAVSADPRVQEVRMLVELVRLSRVTLLFAEPGSDKSAVVRSSVMPLLQEDGGGTVREVAVLLDWWEKVPLAVLNARIDEALAQIPSAHGSLRGSRPSTARSSSFSTVSKDISQRPLRSLTSWISRCNSSKP
jgi:hypothetical protein